MTPEQVAEKHDVRHRLCETSCAIQDKDMPEVVVPCGRICQGRRWEKVDKANGTPSMWVE